MTTFGDRLTEQTRLRATPLCVGFDPFPDLIPAIFGPKGELETLERFFSAVIEEVSGQVPIVKPQIGLFEPWGADGVALTAKLARFAHDQGLLVLMDAKRGDIGSTAEGYARAFLGAQAPTPCDCLTVNPYLGLDSLQPFADAAKANNKGIAVLVRTSNPGAKDFQDIDCSGAPLWVRVGEQLISLQDELMGQSGFSSLMVVCGATWPSEAVRLRTILPGTLFLVPGYGAQGGAAKDALAGLVPGPNGHEGGVVSSSRAILYNKAATEAQSLPVWRKAFQETLKASILELQAASKDVVGAS
ncbi:orotidine-5'-phosphate decarboxylase [Aquidulcibacter sp.]|uniref:orotidine-5'-phosphate decarboxylase n=1 Tax=Aquidulcibacter sp. TaxID=2052990 RepID=UPI0025C36A8B|nr:orotidine-5'-phosphate decarboxylase [Aquidulcibacter sp.]MCA3696294.1 orotidine-5'-phosphate decarboxylase [Aquidulcibacter sp.]